MKEEVICTACPKHCVIGYLGFVEPPKDSPPDIRTIDGINIFEYCRANYIASEEA